jgi:hypothetical protein
MPRTSHDAADQLSFAKRSSLMWTDSIQGMEFAIDVKQGDDSISHHELTCVAGWALFDRRDPNPVRHGAKV